MRIGLDATCLPSSLAGAGRYIHGVVRGLAGIDRENEYFIFIKRQHTGQFGGLPSNMQLVPLPNFSRPLRMAWQHFFAGQHARRLKLEVWHGLHYSLPAFARRQAAVATFHDLGMICHPHFYSWNKRAYFRQAIAQSLRTAAHIVTVSETTAGDLTAWLARRKNGTGHHPAVTAIPSGVEEKFFVPVAATERARVRRAHRLESPFLLFVGTLEKRKNLVALLHAFHLLNERHQNDFVLVLAGQPDNGSREVLATIAQLRLQGRVRLLGYVPEPDLPALYQSAALFVLPSHYEGFGFPLLEAMAGGVVALAADNSSLRELAAHPALLCGETPAAWADKMALVLADQELRVEMSAYERDRARAFSWHKTAMHLREVYESLALPMPAPAVTRNGKALHQAPAIKPQTSKVSARSATRSELREAVRRTLAYADLFDYPLTLAETHYGLFGVGASLAETRLALRDLECQGEIATAEGFYFFIGRAPIVALRQQRRYASQALLRKHSSWLRLLQNFPFVRCVAVSGALAFQNCRPHDDIDLFLVVEKGRLWTIYAGLAVLLKLFGKRRVLCLNCLVDAGHLSIEDQDDFVAHQIAFLQPLSGAEYFGDFFRANDWCRQYLPQMDAAGRLTPEVRAGDHQRARSKSRSLIERLLRAPWFDRFEDFISARYRRRIMQLTQHLHPQAVVATDGQIKLFTNNHRFHVQHKLAVRLRELEAQRGFAVDHAPADIVEI